MLVSLAPMEGLTGYVFRRVHAECFGPLDRYYTPFLSPPPVGEDFKKRDLKEIDTAHNKDLAVVPQLLTKNADEFVWAAQLLAERGYSEVNLNLGCPSGTVTAKGKGSGFLRHPLELEEFLQDVCRRSPLPVSVKTRIGVANDEEYAELLAVFCRCPLAELIVHPRLQKDRYQGSPRLDAYGRTLAAAPFPVAYNGNLFSLDAVESLTKTFPETRHVMLGRGLLTNPALCRVIKGGPAASPEEFERFHNQLFASYEIVMGDSAVLRMKEWWSYAKDSFEDPVTIQRAIRKVRRADDYRSATRSLFRRLS